MSQNKHAAIFICRHGLNEPEQMLDNLFVPKQINEYFTMYSAQCNTGVVFTLLAIRTTIR